MDDVKDKMKGFMKKVNNPFSSSSSSKFKGQGHVLGSGPPPSSSGAATLPHRRPSNPTPRSAPTRPTPPPSSSPAAAASLASSSSSPEFNAFDPLISSGRQLKNGPSPAAFACPVCGRPFPSEADVSAHLDDDECLAPATAPAPDSESADVVSRVAEFVSAAPPEGAVEVVLKLLGNVAREPGNEKFRRIRMGNPKIKEAVGDPTGGVELLECVGFRLGEDGGEVWATMEVPSEEQISLIKEAALLLERWKSEGSVPPEVSDVGTLRSVEPKKIDRQLRVFFPVPESEAAKIDLPDSFYNISASELKREADLRKKKLADSQLLIPKSYREKQAMAARRKYNRTIIRIQFPDGVLLQGVFLPWEPTTVLYEFVSSALKDPSLEFELLRPAFPKLRVIPHFPKPGEQATKLEEEELVPSALLKFKPRETDSTLFTGLTNELLEASEPLTSTAALS
ncbi:hypothetical protein Cni_G28898 [Canna indica]|uniref:UBX domain-containing protein n=1 Tax=Canna indica TaxID=4628 RepID=A0AAQ3L853_9LILI|nr:hypothetical protein Cni_G28898 [Canna indica]